MPERQHHQVQASAGTGFAGTDTIDRIACPSCRWVTLVQQFLDSSVGFDNSTHPSTVCASINVISYTVVYTCFIMWVILYAGQLRIVKFLLFLPPFGIFE